MPAPRIILPALLLALLLPAPALRAADTTFSGQLHPNEFAGIGLGALSPAELTALDLLVAREIAAARQGGVTAFRSDFISRRTPEERTQTGLDKLSAAGQTRLNHVMVAAIAARTPPAPTVAAPIMNTEGIDVRSAMKPEVHGQVTLGYGWGRGGSYRFGGVDTTYYDPQSGLMIGLGVETVRDSGRVGRGLGRDCWHY